MRIRAIILAGCVAVSLTVLNAVDKGDFDPASFPAEKKEDVEAIAAVFRKFPKNADVLYQVAAMHARAGHREEALDLLTQMMKLGTGLDPRSRNFGTLAEDKQFKILKATIRKQNPPVIATRLAYQIDEGDLTPEGIAFSEKTHKFYLGGKRKIVSLAEDGKYEQFVAPGTGGLGDPVGIRVDDSRGKLWVVSNAVGQRKPDMVLGLFCFSLTDGKLIKVYEIHEADQELLNDVAVMKDGSAYATASVSGALWKADPVTGKVEKFLPDKSLPDPNGIFATPDGKYLLVAGWYGITRVDVRKRRTELLDKPVNVADGCLDGMYLYGDKIIGVQNCNHETGRIMEFEVKVDYRQITKARVLASYDPIFDGITTAAIAGDQLYFVANTQMRKMGKAGEKFDPLKVVRLSLK